MTSSGRGTGGPAEPELETARRLLQRAFTAGDIDTLATLMTDDVVWIAGGRPPWVGKADTLDSLRGFFDQFDYDFRLESTRIDRDDDRALERSNFTSRLVDDEGLGPTHRGAVIILWVRQDGWRIGAYLDIGGPMFD